MIPFQESMQEFKKLIKQGTVQQAYRGLMDFKLYGRLFTRVRPPPTVVRRPDGLPRSLCRCGRTWGEASTDK